MFRVARMPAVAFAATALVLATTAPAHAAPPKPGSSCPLSGAVRIEKTNASVCTKRADGSLAWSKAVGSRASSLTARDAWVKAAAAKAMTAGFGTVANPSGAAAHVIAATSPLADAVQLHEVVMKDGAMVMQEKPGGFVIAPGASLSLAPGGNHLMLIGLKKAVKPGQTVPITLITADGGRIAVKALGKTFMGANENYDAAASGSMG